MAQPVSNRQDVRAVLPPARSGVPALVTVGAAGLGSVMLLAALVLWFHYGTAVFFETIAAGISACF